VSASHCAGLTLVVVGSGRLGCDIESATDRDEATWTRLLGPELVAVRDLVAAEPGQSRTVANTRVWTALECLRKAGITAPALTFVRTDPDGWVVLRAGDAVIATWVTSVNDQPDPLVVAVLAGKEG
jgi:hypothetical protein